MSAVISHCGCWTILPNNNCDITLVNLIFILVISSKTTSYINLIFQSGRVVNLTIFMAFVSIKAHNLHIKNFRSLRPVWCLINANQKSWEKFHRLSVCVVMLCFTYSRVQLQQNGKIVTIWCNLHCFFFISHRWGNILIEDLLDIYIFVQIIDSFWLQTQSFVENYGLHSLYILFHDRDKTMPIEIV